MRTGTAVSVTPGPYRKKLPVTRQSLTHKFSVAGNKGYVTVGLYEDGTPGELFIAMAKEGSTISGLMDCFATSISMALQYGVPLKVLCDKFSHVRFEPQGLSSNEQIGYAKSLVDYLFRWLAIRFLQEDLKPEVERSYLKTPQILVAAEIKTEFDGPPCKDCGGITQRAGSCYTCRDCGSTSGCS